MQLTSLIKKQITSTPYELWTWWALEHSRSNIRYVSSFLFPVVAFCCHLIFLSLLVVSSFVLTSRFFFEVSNTKISPYSLGIIYGLHLFHLTLTGSPIWGASRSKTWNRYWIIICFRRIAFGKNLSPKLLSHDFNTSNKNQAFKWL